MIRLTTSQFAAAIRCPLVPDAYHLLRLLHARGVARRVGYAPRSPRGGVPAIIWELPLSFTIEIKDGTSTPACACDAARQAKGL